MNMMQFKLKLTNTKEQKLLSVAIFYKTFSKKTFHNHWSNDIEYYAYKSNALMQIFQKCKSPQVSFIQLL